MDLHFKVHVLCQIDQTPETSLEGCSNWCRTYNGQYITLDNLQPIQKLVKEESVNAKLSTLCTPLKDFLNANCL